MGIRPLGAGLPASPEEEGPELWPRARLGTELCGAGSEAGPVPRVTQPWGRLSRSCWSERLTVRLRTRSPVDTKDRLVDGAALSHTRGQAFSLPSLTDSGPPCRKQSRLGISRARDSQPFRPDGGAPAPWARCPLSWGEGALQRWGLCSSARETPGFRRIVTTGWQGRPRWLSCSCSVAAAHPARRPRWERTGVPRPAPRALRRPRGRLSHGVFLAARQLPCSEARTRQAPGCAFARVVALKVTGLAQLARGDLTAPFDRQGEWKEQTSLAGRGGNLSAAPSHASRRPLGETHTDAFEALPVSCTYECLHITLSPNHFSVHNCVLSSYWVLPIKDQICPVK